MAYQIVADTPIPPKTTRYRYDTSQPDTSMTDTYVPCYPLGHLFGYRVTDTYVS